MNRTEMILSTQYRCIEIVLLLMFEFGWILINNVFFSVFERKENYMDTHCYYIKLTALTNKNERMTHHVCLFNEICNRRLHVYRFL